MTITADTGFGTDITAGSWTIDPSHSEVGFTVRHLMSKVRGQFDQVRGLPDHRRHARRRPGPRRPST